MKRMFAASLLIAGSGLLFAAPPQKELSAPLSAEAITDQQKASSHNFFKLFDAARKAPVRSEFESAADHEDKIGRFLSSTAYGSVKIDSPISIELSLYSDNDKLGCIAYKYDSEDETVRLVYGGSSRYMDYQGSFQPVLECPFDVVSKITGSYIGTNAFGKSVKVQTRASIVSRLIVLLPYKADLFSTEWTRLPKDIAKKSLRGSRLLVIGKLERPFAEQKHLLKKPTLNDPEEVDYTSRDLFIKASEFLVVDRNDPRIELHRAAVTW